MVKIQVKILSFGYRILFLSLIKSRFNDTLSQLKLGVSLEGSLASSTTGRTLDAAGLLQQKVHSKNTKLDWNIQVKLLEHIIFKSPNSHPIM